MCANPDRTVSATLVTQVWKGAKLPKLPIRAKKFLELWSDVVGTVSLQPPCKVEGDWRPNQREAGNLGSVAQDELSEEGLRNQMSWLCVAFQRTLKPNPALHSGLDIMKVGFVKAHGGYGFCLTLC